MLELKYLENLCVPKCEGELNLKRVEDLIKAALMKHIGTYLSKLVPYQWHGLKVILLNGRSLQVVIFPQSNIGFGESCSN